MAFPLATNGFDPVMAAILDGVWTHFSRSHLFPSTWPRKKRALFELEDVFYTQIHSLIQYYDCSKKDCFVQNSTLSLSNPPVTSRALPNWSKTQLTAVTVAVWSLSGLVACWSPSKCAWTSITWQNLSRPPLAIIFLFQLRHVTSVLCAVIAVR